MGVDVGGGAEVGVTEEAGHDSEFLAGLDEQGRGGVPQVVEPLAGEPCPLEGGLESVGDVATVERGPDLGREDVHRGDAFPGLSTTLLHKRGQRGRRELEGSAAPLGLWLPELASLGLEGMADGECPGVEVHVLPAEGEKLALSHAGRHGHGVEHPQPILADRVEQGVDLFAAERSRLAPSLRGRVDQRRHVARHLAHLEGATEGDAEHGVDVADGGWAEPALRGEAGQHALHVGGVEAGKREAAELGLEVGLDDSDIAANRRGSELAADRTLDPQASTARRRDGLYRRPLTSCLSRLVDGIRRALRVGGGKAMQGLTWRLLATTLLMVLGIAACGGAGGSACEAAVREAAEVSAMEDTVEDLDDAIRACVSFDEFEAAAEQFPDALDGTVARTFIANRCEFEPSLADSALCAEVSQ